MIQNMNGLLRIINKYYNFCMDLTKNDNDLVQILSYTVFFLKCVNSFFAKALNHIFIKYNKAKSVIKPENAIL